MSFNKEIICNLDLDILSMDELNIMKKKIELSFKKKISPSFYSFCVYKQDITDFTFGSSNHSWREYFYASFSLYDAYFYFDSDEILSIDNIDIYSNYEDKWLIDIKMIEISDDSDNNEVTNESEPPPEPAVNKNQKTLRTNVIKDILTNIVNRMEEKYAISYDRLYVINDAIQIFKNACNHQQKILKNGVKI